MGGFIDSLSSAIGFNNSISPGGSSDSSSDIPTLVDNTTPMSSNAFDGATASGAVGSTPSWLSSLIATQQSGANQAPTLTDLFTGKYTPSDYAEKVFSLNPTPGMPSSPQTGGDNSSNGVSTTNNQFDLGSMLKIIASLFAKK